MSPTSTPLPAPVPAGHYRVVGLRADGTRQVLADHLGSAEHAESIRKFLGDMPEFPKVVIERYDAGRAGQSRP